METIARIAAIVRDIVWTLVGVLVLVAVVFVLTGGAAGLLPAGLGSGGGAGAGQGGGGTAPTPGGQPGPGGAQSPGGQPPPPVNGQLSVSGSGDFGGMIQGSHVTGTITVQATEGALEKAGLSFTLQPSSGGGFTFMGQVTCLARLSTDPARAIVAGTIRDSNDPAKMPTGSGFAFGLADNAPDQVAFEAGIPVAGDAGAICANESANLFTTNHPGFNLTSGDITIR
jgi:hypothetical protein